MIKLQQKTANGAVNLKIKEVCRKTGLTEKAIRYYVENGLIAPDEYYQRGRTYREYSDEDIEALKNISTQKKIDYDG